MFVKQVNELWRKLCVPIELTRFSSPSGSALQSCYLIKLNNIVINDNKSNVKYCNTSFQGHELYAYEFFFKNKTLFI